MTTQNDSMNQFPHSSAGAEIPHLKHTTELGRLAEQGVPPQVRAEHASVGSSADDTHEWELPTEQDIINATSHVITPEDSLALRIFDRLTRGALDSPSEPPVFQPSQARIKRDLERRARNAAADERRAVQEHEQNLGNVVPIRTHKQPRYPRSRYPDLQ